MRKTIIHELANKISALKSLAEANPDRFDKDILLTIDNVDLLLKYLLDTELSKNLKEEGKRKVYLKNLLEDVASELAFLSNLRDIRVEFSDCDLKLLTNEFFLRRVIYNLLHNAVKFSPRGSVVQVKCSLEKERVFLSILNKVSKSREERKGSGLGLKLTRELVSLLGGELEVQDLGNTFEVILKIPQNKLA